MYIDLQYPDEVVNMLAHTKGCTHTYLHALSLLFCTPFPPLLLAPFLRNFKRSVPKYAAICCKLFISDSTLLPAVFPPRFKLQFVFHVYLSIYIYILYIFISAVPW